MTTPDPTPTPAQVLEQLEWSIQHGNRGHKTLKALQDAAELIRAQAAALAEREAEVERLRERVDTLTGIANRRVGLARDLETELFGAPLPLQADSAEAVTLRALEIIRGLKTRAAPARTQPTPEQPHKVPQAEP